MEQWSGNQYCWTNEKEAFVVCDADVHYYACKYVGSALGFVIDKDVFSRQLQKGRIKPYRGNEIAV